MTKNTFQRLNDFLREENFNCLKKELKVTMCNELRGVSGNLAFPWSIVAMAIRNWTLYVRQPQLHTEFVSPSEVTLNNTYSNRMCP